MKQEHTENDRFGKATKAIVLGIIVMLCFVESFSANGFLPALPGIAKHFDIQAGFMQIAIPVYFLGYLVQIPYGFLSDCYGRKKVIILSYAIFLAGSVICIFANFYIIFLIGRFLQGIGMCSVYLYRPILCDILSEKQLNSVYSALHGGLVIVSAIAPLIGGYLCHFFGWRSIFIALLCLGIIGVIIILLIYPETLKESYNAHSLFHSFIEKNVSLLKNKILILCAVCSMLCFAEIYIIFTISPFLFQNTFGWSTHNYGYLAFGFFLIIASGAMFNSIFVRRWTILRIMSVGIYAALLISILMISSFFLPFYSHTILLCIFCFCFIMGIFSPNTFLHSIKTVNKDVDAGTSFMFFNCIRTIGVLLLVGTSFLHSQSGIVMGILSFIVSFIILILLIVLKQKRFDSQKEGKEELLQTEIL